MSYGSIKATKTYQKLPNGSFRQLPKATPIPLGMGSYW